MDKGYGTGMYKRFDFVDFARICETNGLPRRSLRCLPPSTGRSAGLVAAGTEATGKCGVGGADYLFV